ncbi:hypothetical protein SAMN02745753_00163 [Marinomonas polaris DSM 16579]|uniref:DinB superfamily protein n=1 Tax=Marinomonas polaris DSM 16579 TaxID=1122206 RepID=A0A1M4SZ57_9GAMM|nr:hypothetical protein [Marinomonas polaris]SHE37506.1 hypothetical protein SAMN02745753_00163 [Marinomonas polaris DSM 16579]
MQSVLKNREVNALLPADYSPTVKGCLEVFSQASRCLQILDDEGYQASIKPFVSSSIGEHFRHWLDVFNAIYRAGIVIDYNHRRRGHAVETSRSIALTEIDELTNWLTSLSVKELKKNVNVLTEVSVSHTQACLMSSTLEREIIFAALHANHHFAMVKVAANLMNKPIDDDFGIAPATATFLRGQ